MIQAVLRRALNGEVDSPRIDVQRFVVDKRDKLPEGNAIWNDSRMPVLFLYLLNMCAKAMVKQFTSEGSANPKAADPIGVSAALIFSNPSHLWRGKSLIDIMVAKFRVACPVLFGLRGRETTEEGRKRLGWRREGGVWVDEQAHNDRMAGLGSGFASISLRHFNKADIQNPYPPTNFWKALAFIVNTPASEITNTHYIILRAMIQHNEQRFLKFYGNAGLAALRIALLEFPKKAPKHPAAAALRGIADLLEKEGLILTQ